MSRLWGTRSLSQRLVLLLAVLLLAWGAFVAVLAWRVAAEQEHEALQRLSQGLARHIVEHWPELGGGAPEDEAPRRELLRMLMTVNPGIQVYVLDPGGQVQHYIGEPGIVRQPQVDTQALRRFLAGERLPLYGSDPMGSEQRRLFSVAMFGGAGTAAAAPVSSLLGGVVGTQAPAAATAGYLYIVLDGPARGAVAERLSQGRIWRGVAGAAAAGLLVAFLVGALAVRSLTRPLNRLARDMADLEWPVTTATSATSAIGATAPGASKLPASTPGAARTLSHGVDELAALTQGFKQMRQRLAQDADQQQRLASAHREVIANVAHDLRTPLTALHGHLEALRASPSATPMAAEQAQQHLQTALAQSNKLRHLTQQLFELATLQSMDQVLHSERFRMDELVADAVQKFGLLALPRRVLLAGEAPGVVELDGDLHLIERALTNLIDNAVRHTPAEQAVQVSLQCSESEVAVLVEDQGPGLPAALKQRLDAGESVRDPALKRQHGGGMGGLGLAIAQRIAALHGGRLHTLPAPQGGTRLCLALPRRQA